MSLRTVPQDQSYQNLVVNDTLTAKKLSVSSLVAVGELEATSIDTALATIDELAATSITVDDLTVTNTLTAPTTTLTVANGGITLAAGVTEPGNEVVVLPVTNPLFVAKKSGNVVWISGSAVIPGGKPAGGLLFTLNDPSFYPSSTCMGAYHLRFGLTYSNSDEMQIDTSGNAFTRTSFGAGGFNIYFSFSYIV